MNSAHGRVLVFVKLNVEACNFTKTKTPPWMFFTFLNCTNGTKSSKASQICEKCLIASVTFFKIPFMVAVCNRLYMIFNRIA